MSVSKCKNILEQCKTDRRICVVKIFNKTIEGIQQVEHEFIYYSRWRSNVFFWKSKRWRTSIFIKMPHVVLYYNIWAITIHKRWNYCKRMIESGNTFNKRHCYNSLMSLLQALILNTKTYTFNISNWCFWIELF